MTPARRRLEACLRPYVTLRLWANATPPGPWAGLEDYREPADPRCRPRLVAPHEWAWDDAGGRAEVVCAFAFSGPGPAARGWLLADAGGGVLAAGELAEPFRPLRAGDVLEVRAAVTA